MAAVEMLERGSVKAGPARGGCEGCPSPGGCASCPMRTPTKEALGVSVIKYSSFERVTSPKEVLRAGTMFFNASGEIIMRLKEKICSICQEAASTCGHSKSKTSALAAA